MADRYWVGGTGSWDTTSTTNWSTTSGGTGGASVPTSADDVYFDANSGGGTVSNIIQVVCRTLSFTSLAGDYTGTFSGSAGSINIWGGLNLISSVTFSSSILYFLASTGSFNINTAGKTLTAVTINSQGSFLGVYTLQSALTLSGTFTLTSGTFNTNNYNVTAGTFSSTGTSTRAINLGSSTVTCNLGGFYFATTGLTFDCGTSTIQGGTSSGFDIGAVALQGLTGLTFYNVIFNTQTSSVYGNNTFNNVTCASEGTLNIFDNQTINGSLNRTFGTFNGYQRTLLRSGTLGLIVTLIINGSTSLTDIDFQDIRVVGNAAPISGTRIGDCRGNSGIIFDDPKTVYWVSSTSAQWNTNNWSNTDGGTANGAYYPLAQDTAVFTNTRMVVGGTVSTPTPSFILPSIDMSSRSNAMTLTISSTATAFGDWKNGSSTTITGTSAITFAGRKLQTITSAGKAFTQTIVINSFGGTVELADAINCSNLTFTSGFFNTNNYSVTVGQINQGTVVAAGFNLGSSSVTCTSSPSINLTNTALKINAGTSTLNVKAFTFPDNSTWYNVIVPAAGGYSITGSNLTFNNLTLSAPSTDGIASYFFYSNNITVNGTLTCAGNSAVQRVFLYSSATGTQRTLTVNSLSANYCDFRDIKIAGAAANSSPTNAGNCGNNSGITFPAPKTVYWNLSGTQNWSAIGWATSSGGTPAVNNFPLAQDTAIFNNTGSFDTVTINATWNIGTVDFGSRSLGPSTFGGSQTISVYGNFTFSSSVTNSFSGALNFAGTGTQTITSNGVTLSSSIQISSNGGTVQLADALSMSFAFSLISGTFDAVTYNVTCSAFNSSTDTYARTVKMGSGTWTLTTIVTSGNLWTVPSTSTLLTHIPGTANIVISGSTTNTRFFYLGGKIFNKITIGGTGIDTITFTYSGTIGELASTKTTAHTVTFTFGYGYSIKKWTMTGSAGNVVTVQSSSSATPVIVTNFGPPITGIDYISFIRISFSTHNEIYGGANSTNTGSTGPLFLTTAPTPRTLYWVGGTGNWSSTANWSLSSGGTGGEAIPTSFDSVIFNSASNATAYTLTIDTTARCASFNMSGPASGNITWAGSNSLSFSGDVTLSSTGITRTWNGLTILSGNSTPKTFTTNGVTLGAQVTLYSSEAQWSLGSDFSVSTSVLAMVAGTFSTSNFNITCGTFTISENDIVSLNLGSSTISMSTTLSITNTANTLTLNSGTSTFTFPNNSATFTLTGSATLYNLTYAYNGSTNSTYTIPGNLTLNNLSISAGGVNAGVWSATLSGNITVNGTLSVSGSSVISRVFLKSSVVGTPVTLTVNAFSASPANIDFRDITIAGAAAGTGINQGGDCGGNSGVVFPAPKTVYWNLAGAQNWFNFGWATSSAGTPNINNFPLAQDTAIIDNAGAITTLTIDKNWNIGTMDASSRTNSLTLAESAPISIYGDFKFGTGITNSGAGTISFSGRSTQTILSNGKSFIQPIVINTTPSGIVQLADALSVGTSNLPITLIQGIFNAGIYNVTLSSAALGLSSTGSLTRTLNMGSGTWTISSSTAGATTLWDYGAGTTTLPTGLTHNSGTANIVLGSATATRTFAGSGATFNKLTIGGTGTASTIFTGYNTFSEIASTRISSHTINIGSTTQTVGKWSVSGTVRNPVTVTSGAVSSIGTLILTGPKINTNYLNIQNIRAYSTSNQWTNSWYIGNNSALSWGSYGWVPSNFLLRRLTSTGKLLVNGQFDEVNLTNIPQRLLSDGTLQVDNQFDERTTIPSAKRLLSDGTLQVSDIFDEVTSINT